MTTFKDLGLPVSILQELRRQGFSSPSAIQVATIPDALTGSDILAQAPTGSGKTLAFALPILAHLAGAPSRPRHPRCLVLTPTRELALQIHERIDALAAAVGLRTLAVVGGVSIHRDIRFMATPVDVLIATPGRAIDLMRQRSLHLDAVDILVIDECDQMTDVGFLPQTRSILDQLPSGQRLLFSATLDSNVEALAETYLHSPATHTVTTPTTTPQPMRHLQLHVGDREAHREIIAQIAARPGKTLMFTRTRHSVDRLVKRLHNLGISATGLHGNKGQVSRTEILNAFTQGHANVLIATDIAARGIDISDISLVVHIQPPADPTAYIHRAGRTARAGASGTVVTLVTDNDIPQVSRMFQQAGITPEIVRVTPNSRQLRELTGARRPPGKPIDTHRPKAHNTHHRKPRSSRRRSR
ncbi:DEAD/DEAH box helicase [Corynebacterium freiburgense]|uniref:DEAD/DEAH box helicase n=1 Tax=Corynebacterium freiburgense TaxID=556548 RepID=UPI0003FD3814|nr:DEAD/DEAH box helicase [Corynebacterium freiburgense]WJZ02583.1 ATP-dependent RNA helicase RhlE [Corynebacterium freiburgense]